MNKNLITSSFIICLLYFSCSKSNKSDNVPQNIIKIQLVSGSGQADTIGNPLPNPIIIKVTQNGTPTSGYSVKFVASGCSQADTTSTLTEPSGTTNYNWLLSSDVGQQTLKAYVLNSKNQKIDSVAVTAIGIAAGPGWHNSGCSVQGSSSPTNFCKLSTGRLFTCFGGENTYLRYSDDNGVSWYAVKSLGNKHTITWVMSTPSDELFAFTEGNDGTFYSSDAGKTWSNLGVPPFNTEIFSTITCTPSGKLIALSDPLLNISVDKGKTWSSVPSTAFVPPNGSFYRDPAEDKDGNLYIVNILENGGYVYKSTDGAKSWNMIPETGYNFPADVFAFYIDNRNWFYKSTVHFSPGVYISKDNGTTYNLIIHYSDDEIANMSVQSDGNFYYEDIGGGLYSYDGNSSKLIFGYNDSDFKPYVVAKNNNILIISGHIRYYTK